MIGHFISVFAQGQYKESRSALADGDTAMVPLGRDGRVLVSARDSASVLVSRSPGLESSRVVKTSSGQLISLAGSIESEDPRWLMLFDADAIPDPGTEPLECWRINGPGTFSYEPPGGELRFSVGLVWAISTAADALALDVVNSTRIVAAYQ